VQVKLLEACVLMVACEGKETTSCDLFVVWKNGVKEKREWVEQASDFSEVEMEWFACM
jgi:hypothetical protein